jgi:mannose-1-phosphate guanylyltransferase
MHHRSILPVILAGGSGTRLWPLSVPSYPKQFLKLFNQYSFLQNTVMRLKYVPHVTAPLVICGQQHTELVNQHLAEISTSPIAMIIEPIGANTAPAVGLAAVQQLDALNDPILLVLPSDHMIVNTVEYQHAIQKAASYADQGYLVMFGILPETPNTHYGYIKLGEAVLQLDHSMYHVDQFVEKPSVKLAEQYLAARVYSWNSGMFMFRASVFLNELEIFEPAIFSCCQSLKKFLYWQREKNHYSVPLSIFEQCPKQSIDYGVMEKTKRALVMRLDIGWSDIGSWHALWNYRQKDAQGNAVWGDVMLNNVKNSLIYAQDKAIALHSVENRIVVHANNEVFEENLFEYNVQSN